MYVLFENWAHWNTLHWVIFSVEMKISLQIFGIFESITFTVFTLSISEELNIISHVLMKLFIEHWRNTFKCSAKH